MRNYRNLLKAIEKTGIRAWLVGDSVRMIEMGIQPELLTLALDSQDLYGVASALGTGTVESRGMYPVLRGELEGVSFRGFSLQGSTIEDDLARRDLSIEAIALRSDGGVVDPFGGIHDIRNKVIRLTGDNVKLIEDDPLRIIRMLRFAAELEMDVFWKSDADVRKFLELHADKMNEIPPERWGREIIGGMKRRPWRFIQFCDAYNLLPFFLKELDDLKHISDGKGGSLFEHVMNTLRVIETRLDTHKVMQSEAFILAGLFSRIGTQSLVDNRDRRKTDRFVMEYLTKWNIPSETIDEVIAIISGYHGFYNSMTEEELCAYVLEYSSNAVAVALEFAACIALVERLPFRETLEENQWRFVQVLRRFNSVARQMDGATRFLTGREVMALLNLAPGPRVGELLEGLDMAVGTGKVSSRAGAEAWLMSNAKSA